MNQLYVNLLRENLHALNLNVDWLQRSCKQTAAIGRKAEYTADEFDLLENLASRYARTTDMLVNKVLRNIDKVELEDVGTIIDVMNRAEKREIVPSAEVLHSIKDLRNSIVHEYRSVDITGFFGDVQKYAVVLLEIIENVNKYCKKYLAEES